jgi:FAD:protein FMN transferase
MTKLSSFILFFLLIMLTACDRQSRKMQYYRIAGFAQGTTYHMSFELPDSVDIQPQVDSILRRFDSSLSEYDSLSVISRINRNEDIETDGLFNTVFIKSYEVFKASGGRFDITVMPLVNVWGFGPGRRTQVDSAQIDSILDFVGMDKVKLENNRIIKADPRVQLDVNALAQGYSVDIVCAYMDSLGSENYLIEIGGEIRAKGVNQSGKLWRIGIDKPEFGNMIPGSDLEAIVELDNKSLATSGNYRKYYEEDGVKYHHSINPFTGYPARQSILSATIVADDCITADAYATVCMVGGLEYSKKMLSQHPELEAYLIYGDEAGSYQLYTTRKMNKMVVTSEGQ